MWKAGTLAFHLSAYRLIATTTSAGRKVTITRLNSTRAASVKQATGCSLEAMFAPDKTQPCRKVGRIGYLAVTASAVRLRVTEAGETLVLSVGNGQQPGRWRVKGGDAGGPWANVKHWRCEPLSFAYFSLRRQRKVGAAPHRGNACEPQTKRGCPRKGQKHQTATPEAANKSQMPAQRQNQSPITPH